MAVRSIQMYTCKWCKREFEPTSAEQQYCGNTHKRAAQRYRVAHPEARVCPNPRKMKFDTKAKANKYLRSIGGRIRLFPYECRCGKWHLHGDH